MKKEILRLINELDHKALNSDHQTLNQITAILEKSEDSSGALSYQVGGYCLLQKVFLCGIHEQDDNKKALYAKVIATILEKSPPYSLTIRTGPLEILAKRIPGGETTYLAYALTLAIQHNSHKVFVEVIKYFSSRANILSKRTAGLFCLELLSKTLEEAVSFNMPDRVECLLSILSGGLEPEKAQVLRLVLDRILIKERSVENAIVTSVSSDRQNSYTVVKVSSGPPLRFEKGVIYFYQQQAENEEETYYFCWDTQPYGYKQELIPNNLLQVQANIFSKELTILEYLKGFNEYHDDSRWQVYFLDLFLSIGQGCPSAWAENIYKIFLLILEKASLYPTLLCDFLTQKSFSGNYSILNVILDVYKPKVTIADQNEQLEMNIRHSLSIKLLNLVLFTLFSSQLSEESLKKVEVMVCSFITSFSDRNNGIVGYEVANILNDVNNIIIKHWIEYLLTRLAEKNSRALYLDKLLNLLIKQIDMASQSAHNRKLHAHGLLFALQEIKRHGQMEILLQRLPVAPPSSIFHTPIKYTNLLNFAIACENSLAIKHIVEYANESVLKAILPLQQMQELMAFDTDNNDELLNQFIDSEIGKMLCSRMMRDVLENLSTKASETSNQFISWYYKVFCLLSAKNTRNLSRLSVMAVAIMAIPDQQLFILLQQDPIILLYFASAVCPLTDDLDQMPGNEKKALCKHIARIRLSSDWDFSGKELSLQEIAKLLKMAWIFGGDKNINMASIIISSCRRECFFNAKDQSAWWSSTKDHDSTTMSSFTLNLKGRGNLGLSEKELVSFLGYLADMSLTRRGQSTPIFTIFIDGQDKDNLSEPLKNRLQTNGIKLESHENNPKSARKL